MSDLEMANSFCAWRPTTRAPFRNSRKLLRSPPKTPYPFMPPENVEYASMIDLSSVAQWKYPLKTLPCPKGKATRVIITQYDLPRKYAVPHDGLPDSEGSVWYSDHGQPYLGRLDPQTGKVVEYPLPVLKPEFPDYV